MQSTAEDINPSELNTDSADTIKDPMDSRTANVSSSEKLLIFNV